MVEQQPSKLNTRVRFPSPAPNNFNGLALIPTTSLKLNFETQGIPAFAIEDRGRLTPHAAHAGAYVHLWSLAWRACRGTGRHNGPGRSLEQIEKLFWNEARPGGIEVAVALRVLAVDEEALRHDQMEAVLCARHRDVEQPAFLLDFGRGAGTEVGRHAAVDDVEQIDRLPLLAFGGVDRRQDQIVLVEQRHAGLVAGRVGWIQRELGQEALA